MAVPDCRGFRERSAFGTAFFLSAFGYEVLFFCMTLRVYDISRKAIEVGVFTAITLLPKLISPACGVLVDRLGARRTLIWAGLFTALLAAGLPLAHGPGRALRTVAPFIGPVHDPGERPHRAHDPSGQARGRIHRRQRPRLHAPERRKAHGAPLRRTAFPIDRFRRTGPPGRRRLQRLLGQCRPPGRGRAVVRPGKPQGDRGLPGGLLQDPDFPRTAAACGPLFDPELLPWIHAEPSRGPHHRQAREDQRGVRDCPHGGSARQSCREPAGGRCSPASCASAWCSGSGWVSISSASPCWASPGPSLPSSSCWPWEASRSTPLRSSSMPGGMPRRSSLSAAVSMVRTRPCRAMPSLLSMLLAGSLADRFGVSIVFAAGGLMALAALAAVSVGIAFRNRAVGDGPCP